MTKQVTTSLKNWKFQDQHVQQNLTGGDFAASHSTILCATAPRLEDLMNGGSIFTATSSVSDRGSEFAIPLGVVDSAGINQSRQIAQVFELGSKRSYILSSRTSNSLSLGRVFFKGPSLLRMLYAYYPADKLSKDTTSNVLRDLQNDNSTSLGNNPIAIDPKMAAMLPEIQNNPGFDNFFMNLDSDLFSQPMGLVIYFKDNADKDIGALFLEDCNITTHGMSVGTSSVVIAESVSVIFDRVIPLKVNVVDVSNVIGSPSTTITDILQTATSALDSFGNLISA